MNNKVLTKLKDYDLTSLVFKVVVYLLLTGLAFVFLYPFMSMIIDSFKSYSDITNNTVKWIPRDPTTTNYILAFEVLDVFKTGWNSLIVTVLSTVGHVFSCALVAYGFARFNFPLKSVLFGIVILTILIPTQTLIIPSYITWMNYGMLNTHLPMVLPTFFGFGLRGGIFIFLFWQYFLKIPKSLEEAAMIDGCGRFKTFAKVVFPTTGATLIVCILLSIVWHFNDSYEPSIYLSNTEKYLLPQMLEMLNTMLSQMQNDISNAAGGAGAGSGAIEQIANEVQVMYHRGVVMAATTICLAPLFVVYVALQRKFIAGVERSGLTGE